MRLALETQWDSYKGLTAPSSVIFHAWIQVKNVEAVTDRQSKILKQIL